MKRRYLLNRDSGTLHKVPASESCNEDQVRRRSYFHFDDLAQSHPRFRRLCTRCFPRGWK
jgi:hypothetical protein